MSSVPRVSSCRHSIRAATVPPNRKRTPPNRLHPPELVGSQGILVLRDLPVSTVVALYEGRAWTQHAAAELFVSSMLVDVHLPSVPGTLRRHFVFDGRSGGNGVAELLNDYRMHVRQFTNNSKAVNDPTRQNAQLLTLLRQGVPLVALVTTRALTAGDWLFGDYGEAYWSAWNANNPPASS